MSEAPARVVFTTGFSRRYTGGVAEFAVAAKTLRGVIREMDRKFPGLAETLEEETTVAIDGELYEIDFLRRSGRGRRCSSFRRSRVDDASGHSLKTDPPGAGRDGVRKWRGACEAPPTETTTCSMYRSCVWRGERRHGDPFRP